MLPCVDDDPIKLDQWDAYNNLVIAWIMNNVSDAISKSILFVPLAAEVWSQLEKRFAVRGGSRKYQLNCDLFNLEQDGGSIRDNYTELKGMWEEILAMSALSQVISTSTDIVQFLATLAKQQEEQRLFQFLNGIDDDYNSQRTQILLMIPLPSVETAYGSLQQEELQKEVLDGNKLIEPAALLSEMTDEK